MHRNADILTEVPEPGLLGAAWMRVVRMARSAGVRGGLISVFDQGVVSATNFFTTIIIGRLCGPHELGAYYLAFSAVLLARGFQYHLVSAPYLVYWNKRPGNTLATYVGSTLAHQIVLGGLAALGFLGFSLVLSLGWLPGESRPLPPVLILVIPLILIREFIRYLEMSHLRMATAAVVDCVVSAIQLGALLALGGLGWLSVSTAYLVIGGACGVAWAGWWLVARHPLRIVPRDVLSDWRANWAFGKWALAGHLVGSSWPYFMPWVIAAAKGELATGVLGACSSLVGVTNLFVIGLGEYLSARAARAYAAGSCAALRDVLWQFALIFLVTLGPFCLLAMLAGSRIMVWVYGADYAGTGPIVALLAASALARSLGMIGGAGLWVLDRPRANMFADTLTLVSTLGMALALVGRWGVLGIAVATLAGSLVGGAARLWTLYRWMHVHAHAVAGAGGAS